MALFLPSSTWPSQSSFNSLGQSTLAVNRRSCPNRSWTGGAVPFGVLLNQHSRSSISLQARTAYRSERHQLLGARQQWRALSGSSDAAPLNKTDEDLTEQEVVDVIASPTIAASTDIVSTTTQPPPQASLRHQSQKPGGRQGGGGGSQWILGPLALLVTGALPALWLPSPTLFSGSATAGLLALTGLDATFNIGATAFLLMANSSAGGKREDSGLSQSSIPLGYKVWSFMVNLVGLVAPISLVVASLRGVLQLQPSVQLVPAAALLGPYTLLLVVQWLGEALVWQWQSPVWPVLPLVYQAYRLLQLTRGVELGLALDAPAWLVEAVKGLVAWWVFVLGMQIMWVAWLVGTIQAGAARRSE